MYKLMVIEDEADIRDELVFLLQNEGYSVYAVTDFTDVLTQVKTIVPDLILLDLNLPQKSGFVLCAEIRKAIKVPIIFVTSSDNSMDELSALSLGGDDYITKPYNIPVLLARLKAVLRRYDNGEQESEIEHNGLVLNIAKGIIIYNEKSCELTKNEIKILNCLMNKAGKIVSRTDLIEYLWDSQIYIDDNTLSVNMTRLRSKLSDVGLESYISTKRGMGYRV